MPQKSYFGYRLHQRVDENTVPFFVFQARAKDIQNWAGIRRVPDMAGGTQRAFREPRARAIARFLKADSLNTIPNSVLLAFEPGKTSFSACAPGLEGCTPDVDLLNGCSGQMAWGVLTFEYDENSPEHERPALIVDGQHRLNGMYEFLDEDIPVMIVSLIDASPKEQAFQFIVVNNKVVRVPTESAKSIIADLDDADEDELGRRLLKAGIKYKEISPILREINDLDNSPFKDLLDWSYNRDGVHLVSLTAIEQSLRYLRSLFTFLGDDEDSLLEMFLAIWRAMKNQYEDLWGEDNKFMTKVNINALNEFVADRLKMAWEFGLLDIFQPDQVQQQTERIMDSIPEEFWKANWGIRIQDNANIRTMIKDDLAQMAENRKLRKEWNADLKVAISGD